MSELESLAPARGGAADELLAVLGCAFPRSTASIWTVDTGPPHPLEELQLSIGEGPVLDVSRSGAPVFVADPAGIAARWPRAAAALGSTGVAAVLAVPVRGTVVDGALTVYVERPRRWSGQDIRLVTAAAAAVAQQLDCAGRLQRAERLLSAQAMLSHDVRNRLAAVAGFAALLRNPGRLEGDELEEVVAGVVDNIDVVLDVSDIVIDLSVRPDGGDPPVTVVDLGQAVGQIVRRLSPLAVGRVLETRIDDGVRATADERRLARVLGELLVNARKYSPEGSTVTVSVADRDGRPCVRVDDQGCGVRPEQRSRVFDASWRDPCTAALHDGSGLGLAMVRELASAMGATVRVEGNTAGGAAFILELAPAPGSRAAIAPGVGAMRRPADPGPPA